MNTDQHTRWARPAAGARGAPVVVAAFVVALGLLATAVTASWFVQHEREDVETNVDLIAADVEAHVDRRLDTAVAALRTLAAGISTGALDDAEVRDLLAGSGVVEEDVGVQALAWAPVTGVGGQTTLLPLVVHPVDSERPVPGLDLLRDPDRRPAVEAARDTGAPASTTGLLGADGDIAAVLVVVPVYDGSPTTPAARRAAFTGVAIAVLDPGAVFADVARLPANAVVEDGGSALGPGGEPMTIWSTDAVPGPEARTYELALADRMLRLSLAPAEGFPGDHHTIGVIVLAGTLLSLLLGVLAGVRVGRKQRLEDEVAERTRELQRANEELQRASELRSQFITTVSHELRTPLTSVLGFVQTVRRIEALEPQVRDDFLARAERNGLTLRRMIEELLEFGQVERGEIELQRAVVDVGSLVASMGADFRPAIGARGLDIDAAPGVLAEIDQGALHRIIANLLSNAQKYAPGPDPVEIIVRRHQRWVEVVCADRGPGFAPEDLPKLLERFVRGAGVMGQGTGIGLALVRELALAHGGDVLLRNRPGGGAEVVVRLPAVHTSIAPAPAPAAGSLAAAMLPMD